MGLRLRTSTRPLPDGRSFLSGWLWPEAVATEPTTTADGGETLFFTAPARGERPGSGPPRGLRIALRDLDGEIRVDVPLATPEECLFAEKDGEIAIANDLRLLARWLGLSIEPRAVYALFQHGAVPPPYTLLRGARRVPGGHVLSVAPGAPHPRVERRETAWALSGEGSAMATAESLVERTLDGALARLPAGAVLLFSGGVDSSLVAALLASAGRRDVLLLNFRFGSDDAETAQAEEVARHLGLRFEAVGFDPDAAAGVLARVGDDYTHPFGDFSTLVSNPLAAAGAARSGTSLTLVDGTGADGAFGIGARAREWHRLAQAPALLRSAAVRALAWSRPWHRTGRLERAWRALARSVTLPLPLAAITAQNSLEGVAYRTPREIAVDLEAAFDDLMKIAEGRPERDRLAWLDLAHVCAGQFAAKTFDPARRTGTQPVYPFLEPEMIAASFSIPWEIKCADGEPKAILKRILARSVPPRLVYREKSGFVPPLARVLARPDVGALLHETLLSPRNPLLEYCDRPFLETVVLRARTAQPLSYATMCHLWAHLFTTLWIVQQ